MGKKVAEYGAGRSFLIRWPGTPAQWIDLSLINTVSKAVRIPVIACGGAGGWHHFSDVFEQTKADAVAAANIFIMLIKVYIWLKNMFMKKCPVRPPDLTLEE